MATLPLHSVTDRGEARFFLIMAATMSALIVGGFSLNIVTGRSSFAAPWQVHLHALIFMGWIGLYLAQNSLIYGGNVALHRRLGWLSLAWLPMMLVGGLFIISHKMTTTGAVPFFDQNQFLISATLHLFGFFGLSTAAIAVRKDTGWHRRLMLCGFAMLTGPGVGRLLPMPLLIPYGWWIGTVLAALLFPIIGLLADRRRYGHAHPAWLVGIATILGLQIVGDLIAYSPLGYQFTEWFIAGTPGAERPMEAHWPPM